MYADSWPEKLRGGGEVVVPEVGALHPPPAPFTAENRRRSVDSIARPVSPAKGKAVKRHGFASISMASRYESDYDCEYVRR